MSLFKRRRVHEKIVAPAAHAAQSAAGGKTAGPVYKYRINEDLANKIATRAYGLGADGRPNIPRMPFSG